MPVGALTTHLDVAQVVLYAFWIFFAILILYLRREDRREGYPLVSEPRGGSETPGWFMIPDKKLFRLFHGGTVTSPQSVPASQKERPDQGCALEPLRRIAIDPNRQPHAGWRRPGLLGATLQHPRPHR